MKIRFTFMHRLAVIALTLGGFTVVRADTQAEKGDAGDDLATAEILDCKKDKITGTMTVGDCDLYCFYWPGGNLSCTLEASFDCGIMIFDETGRCVAANDDHGGVGTPPLPAPASGVDSRIYNHFLPKGCYYVFCGHFESFGTHTLGDYNTNTDYCRPDDNIPPNPSLAGPLYKVKNNSGASGTYTLCFHDYEHVGKPMELDATCGKKKGQAGKIGSGTKNTSGKKQVVKVMKRGPKATCYFQCESQETTRAATGIKITNVSKRKFKPKYRDVTGGGNITADIKRGDFCKNYNPGFKQIIRCDFKAKGVAKNGQTKGKAKFRCNSALGEKKDTAVCQFYTKFRG